MKIIEIEVSPTGETKIETKGFVGNECQKASRFLVGALGNTAAEQLKPEFHTQIDSSERINNNA